jgi:hypothetical protein
LQGRNAGGKPIARGAGIKHRRRKGMEGRCGGVRTWAGNALLAGQATEKGFSVETRCKRTKPGEDGEMTVPDALQRGRRA